MTDRNKILENIIASTKKYFEDAEGGHDFWHAYRVMKIAGKIAGNENADIFICEVAALVHDIADPKFHNGDEKKGSLIASGFLSALGLDEHTIRSIMFIIENVSFKGGINNSLSKSIELQVVQDADRLDALGAIGIARTFHYGGYKNRKIYDPEIQTKNYSSPEEYRKSDAPSINHFYEKLLLLKDLMNTKTGKKIAKNRHAFLESYLKQFFNEWNGEK